MQYCGLFTVSSFTSSGSGTITILNNTHPVTNGFPATIPAQNATSYATITNADNVKLGSYNTTYSVISYRPYGLGKAIYIGYDYFSYDTYASFVIANAMQWCASGILPDWLSMSNTSGTIPAGGSATIPITVDAAGMISGTYTTGVIFTTNDPLHPTDTLSVTMIVNGIANMTLSASCLNYGSHMMGTINSDTLMVFNTGCDTLFVTGITSSLTEFVPSSSAFYVLPGDTGIIAVQFSPDTIETYSGNLTINTNIGPSTVCLTGTGLGAPAVSIVPDNVTLYVNTCNGTAGTTVSIQNSGLGPLEYDADAASSGTLQVLALTYGADLTTEYPQTLAAINAHFTDYTLTEINTTSATALQTALTGKDVLLIPELETASTSVITSFSSVIQNFATNGGTVIICSGYNTLQYCGLFTVSSFTSSGSGTITILNNTHPVTNGFPATIPAQNATSYATITNADNVKLGSYNTTYSVISYRPYGLGKAIYIGYDYFSYDTYASFVIANAMQWCASGILPDWLSMSNTSGTIPAGGSATIPITVDAAGMISGTYTTGVIFTTNDPLHPTDTLSVTMIVNGEPEMIITQTCLNFGTIMQFSDSTKILNIYNTGCDTLFVSSVSAGTSAYTVSPSSLVVLPGDTGFVSVTFYTFSTGSFPDTLDIFSNDFNTTVCLTGSTFLAPAITVVPSSLNVSLGGCNDSTQTFLTIGNTGGSNLSYTITGSGTTGGGPLKVLALLNAADLTTEYPHTITAINQYFTNYTLTEINAASASALTAALVGKNVLLIPELENATSSTLTNLIPVIQTFAQNGGIVIICYGVSTSVNYIFSTGLFSGTVYSSNLSGTMTVPVPGHPLAAGLPSSFSTSNATSAMSFTNTDVENIVKYSTYATVAWRPVGVGKAIFIGYDYYAYDNNAAKIIANALAWAQSQSHTWISLSQTSGIVTPGSSNIISVEFNSTGLSSGTYTTVLQIASNDPLSPLIQVPCTLTVGNNPCAAYTYTTGTCNGQVTFSDVSVNNPIFWSWNFGDGTYSSLQNPVHTYTTPGSFVVTLITCNAYSCDTITDIVNITGVSGPVSPSCVGTVTYTYTTYGISSVLLNTISHVTALGEGYNDYTCSQSTMLTIGQTYSLSVNTSLSYYHNIRVWIDYNNNATFDTGELVVTANTVFSNTTQVTIPTSAIINVPLRMRVATDYYSYTPTTCSVNRGEIQDYTIILQSNTVPPNAAFAYTVLDICQGVVLFTDQTTNMPTQWLWNFGDGTTSGFQNPYHAYTQPGTYSVLLTVTNAYGSDTYSVNVIISMLSPDILISGTHEVMQLLTFSCSQTGITSYNWNFGDGYTATVPSPVHVYTAPGTYTITLTVSNGTCTTTVTEDIIIDDWTKLQDITNVLSPEIFPNPSNGEFTVVFPSSDFSQTSLEISDIQGRKIYQCEIKSPVVNLHLNRLLCPGVYSVKFYENEKTVTRKLVVE